MELSDVFVFVDEYNPQEIIAFKNEFLSDFKSMDEYYQYPKYSQETIFETGSFNEMFKFITDKPGRPFTFYFENSRSKEIKQGIIKINENGSMCLAVSVLPEYETKFVGLLKNKYPLFKVFVSYNSPLPSSINELQ